MKRTIFWALLLIAAGCSSKTTQVDPVRVTRSSLRCRLRHGVP
ncbi:MAG: hypothetical protein ACLS6N_10655 [Alistipes finegoldii]